MNRTTNLTGVHTTDAGRIRTLQSGNSRFYIELEFFNPMQVVELAELCREGDLYKYAHGLITRLESQLEINVLTRTGEGESCELDDPSLVLSEGE